MLTDFPPRRHSILTENAVEWVAVFIAGKLL
jgi:hypothetical protein